MKIQAKWLHLFICFVTALATACSNSSSSSDNKQTKPDGSSSSIPTGENVMRVDVGATCGGYVNEPCVSVTVCVPNTDQCQVISRLLLDTGSYGLRIFASALTLNLPSKSSNGGTLHQCVGYLDGTSHWGPVKIADLKMAEQKALSVPIQIIDASQPGLPEDCLNLESSPEQAGFNGILGVGGMIADCGEACAMIPENRIYFTCLGSNCIPAPVPVQEQVANPIVFLETDNNGLILQFPSIPSQGVASTVGSLTLGIGTRANNTPSEIQIFPADSLGNFRTEFNNTTYFSAFIDSGSNGFYFPPSPGLEVCMDTSNANGFYCPASLVNLTATLIGSTGSPKAAVNFQIANASQIATAEHSNWAFNNLGGVYSGGFDWGMPFFFGRTVMIGIENHSSTYGQGPYWGL